MNRRKQEREPRGPDRGLEDALRSDAGRIRAGLSPEFDRRLAAAMARAVPDANRSPRTSPLRSWLTASLAGAATAALVILLLPRHDPPAPTPSADTAVARPAPESLRLFREQVPLNAETAALTAPLEEELRDLRSDLEKAREHFERDLRRAF